ncbi:ABC transporter permease [Marinimicrobium sp. C6131]|uniref:ABC transporter permease n=1 Tax=Marinimicrobium sp. C6131 TaxID=3022676 RepID=UPI00223D9B33|nr:ABC transporter permease [Marinimicrobium sp. C6131]UZJ43889.1 ABC transporter permease [Marinimicrobium sp. C6131]
MLIQIARASLWNRRTTVALTLLALSIGVALLLGIDHLRHQAKDSFRQTLSGTDLIVGPRGGQTNLLLYSVFQMGQPGTSLSPSAFERLAHHPMVDWAVPIALGDTVQGFPVFATHWSYFEHYRYGERQPLAFARGRPFAAHSGDEVVLGATAARELGYGVGDSLVVAHGSAGVSFTHHDDHPMTVVGILEPTGTPADRRVHMTLLAMESLHGGEAHDAHPNHAEHSAESHEEPHGHDDPGQNSHDHSDHGHEHHEPDHHDHHGGDHGGALEPVPGNINAVLLGLKSRPMVFVLQRELNTAREEPMTAVLPGVALTELWQLLAVAENLLYLISFLVLLATLAGMMTMLLASMGERRRELAILRTVGASGLTLMVLIELEVALITLLSLVLGTLLLMAGLALAQPWLASEFGLFIAINPMGAQTAYLMLGILGLALLMGLVPALAAYRRALAAGLNPRQ